MASHHNRMMKGLYFFRPVTKLRYTAPCADDDQSAPARLQTTRTRTSTSESLRRSQLTRSCRTMSSFNFSGRTLATPAQNDVGGRGDECDDCTVVSNATTVKAGTTSTSRRRLQLQGEKRKSSSCHALLGISRSSRSVTATTITTTPPRRRGIEKVQDTTSPPLTPPSTVHSDDGENSSPKRKGALSFWKNGICLRNDKLSTAAMELAQDEPTGLVETPRCSDIREVGSTASRSKPMLSLPMKRFLVESLTDAGSSPSMAEF